MNNNQPRDRSSKRGGFKKSLAGFVLFATVMSFGGVAFAEGSWTSSITGALTGFDSRNWTDKKIDNANTTIKLEGCRNVNVAPNAVTTTDVQLQKNNNNWPDESKGTKILSCRNSATGNWGNVAKGDYYFRIKKIDGNESGGRLNVTKVTTAY